VDRIYNYIFHRTGNPHDAEDLTARTFYRALTNIQSYTDRGAPFSAWLYRIAHNLVANWHRDQSRRQVISLDELVVASRGKRTRDQMAEQLEEAQALQEAIRRLHPDRQLLLILKFSEGMSNVEIGQVMGRSEGAIKSLYHRTLLALREELQERMTT
jgi:RNA polymerase sigma-70 factor (ECF subfamily)